MEKVSSTNAKHQHSPRKTKAKRLTDDSLSHSPGSQMSESALKRWEEARDTYLGGRYLYKKKHRQRKQKNKTTKKEENVSFFTCEPDRFSIKDLSLEQPQIIHDHVEDKCVGTETNESILIETDIEQIDEGIQVDLPSPELELHPDYDKIIIEDEKKEEIQSDQESIEYNDKTTETDLILNINKEDEIDQQSTKETIIDSIPNINKENEIDQQSTKETIIDSIPNIHQPDVIINDDDTKIILSSNESNTSASKQLFRLQHRFKRLSRERRLLCCLLVLYIIIMLGLLVVIFILSWTYQERSSVLNRTGKIINNNIIDGVARYGELCKHDNDCKRPFTCFKKPSSSGICRCPLKYNFINNQCIGDLNALCKKDIDCQRYMLCSGMQDGTRRCHCQTLYKYDTDRQQCRGDYHAPCQNQIDCQANLICNKTIIPSLCLCQLNYQYYPLVHKCRGNPGAICEQKTAECTDNAECRDGACECAFQFVPNEKKICIDPCPKTGFTRVKIRYPGNCRRFIDCQKRTKNECPEKTIFNFRTQLCDYPKNVLDCR